MKNKFISLFLIVILLLLPSFFPNDESRFDEWSKVLLCPVCQGETIYDSPSSYADDMKSVLLSQIEDNFSDDEIYNFWVSRYGEKIITNPINNNKELVIIPLFIITSFVALFVRKINAKK